MQPRVTKSVWGPEGQLRSSATEGSAYGEGGDYTAEITGSGNTDSQPRNTGAAASRPTFADSTEEERRRKYAILTPAPTPTITRPVDPRADAVSELRTHAASVAQPGHATRIERIIDDAAESRMDPDTIRRCLDELTTAGPVTAPAFKRALNARPMEIAA